jgi:L-iditol 2-dehydrogenase
MNAALFYGPNDLKIENIDINTISQDEIVLKTLSCSVCSYDVRTFRNGSFKVTPPVILGHEICAETIADYRGKNFSIKSNSRVSIYPVIPCFACWFCMNRKYNLCLNLKEVGSTVNGGFAEFIKVPKKIFEIGGIVPVPEEISSEEASLIEPLACCINGINQIKNLDFESVIIIGDGPIGLMQLMLLKKILPRLNITMIGKISHRLESARRMGADKVVEIKDDYLDQFLSSLKELNGHKSPNLIFISNNDSNSINLALKLVNKNGKIVIFSGIKKNQETKNINAISIDPNFIHYDQISIYGSFSSNPENLNEAMSVVSNHEINLNDLITHIFPLKDLEKALKVAESFSGLKSIINKF